MPRLEDLVPNSQWFRRNSSGTIDAQTDAELAAIVAANPAELETVFDAKYGQRESLRLPGTSGNYLSTPDHSSLDITGDLDLIWLGDFAAWFPAITTLIGKANATGSARSYYLQVSNFGVLSLTLSNNGTATTAANASTAVSGVVVGTPIWVRATWR